MLKKITISGIETKQFGESVQYVLKDGNTKYKFYSTKQDGTESKAYQQFLSMNLKSGDAVMAEVKEQEKEYNGKKYIDRRIAWFTEKVSSQTSITEAPSTEPRGRYVTATEFNKLVASLNSLAKKVHALEMLSVDAGNKEALEFHEVTANIKEDDGIPVVKDEIKLEDLPF